MPYIDIGLDKKFPQRIVVKPCKLRATVEDEGPVVKQEPVSPVTFRNPFKKLPQKGEGVKRPSLSPAHLPVRKRTKGGVSMDYDSALVQ